MARRPRRSHVTAARRGTAPIRFIADYDHVEVTRTTTYKAGTVLIDVPMDVRRGALATGKAVLDGE